MKIDWKMVESLSVGRAVKIRRTSGAEQRATVEVLADGREYRAPEVHSFEVSFTCDTTGKRATRWCTAFDLIAVE
jgi:hypothetical protein